MIGLPIAPMRRGSMTDKSRRRLRRRLSAALLLLIGLAVAGGLAATLTPDPQVAVADESQSALLRTGKQLFDTSCVTCHGANLQGVPDRGPSLIGVGEAAVYFQVSTGRMPAMRGEAQAARKPPIFDDSQIDALGAYVQANGGGPVVPRTDNGQVASESLIGDNVIANIHCGWRGAVQGIIDVTLDTAIATDAWLGPSIRVCCFEVGEEVAAQFDERYVDRSHAKPHVDIPAFTKDILRSRGFGDDAIIDTELCTRCDGSIFHSYRREGKGGGRNLAIVAQ